ncbi:MAG: NAD(P)H-dependent oxidoreductase [Gammaproteobacteria bacterium]|nr:NAD(P)H-dependent oxidoreductase [Gammaproteobacteria bacterium]
MTKLLTLKSSLLGDTSVSNELIDNFIDSLTARGMELETVTRDLSRQGIPHLDGEWLSASSAPATRRTNEQQQKINYADELISELKAAELIVIGAPMYNFMVPTQLKAWIDHVAKAGITFRYTENGSVGLLNDKEVVVVVTSGGIHKTGETDHMRPFLKTVLGFLGLNNVEFAVASGLNMGPETREAGINHAREYLNKIADQLVPVDSFNRVIEEVA